MNTADAGELPTSRKRLWFWAGRLSRVLWLVRLAFPSSCRLPIVVGLIGGLVGALAVMVWWAFFSRAPRLDRWGAVLLMIIALAATRAQVDCHGTDGHDVPIYAVPVLGLAFLVWATFRHRLSDGPRRGGWSQPSGIRRLDARADQWHYRRGRFGFRLAMEQNPEKRLLAQPDVEPVPSGTAGSSSARGDSRGTPRSQDGRQVFTPANAHAGEVRGRMSGFRGPGRDSIIPAFR